MPETPATLAKLQELLAAIRTYDDPRRASTEWKQVYRLLEKTELPSRSFAGIVGMRHVDGLAELIERLGSDQDPTAAEDVPPPEVCKKALQAFRRRAKLTRLDDESKLGHSPLSKGGDPSLGAITPPDEWPAAVWRELVRQGKLRDLGHGLYELAEKG